MSAELVFYGAPQARAVTVHWMLEELGVPFEMRAINLKKDEQKQPAYPAVNPMGKVPAIVHRGVAITEAAAICCYLADVLDRKSTRLTPVTNAHIVCRLLLEKKNNKNTTKSHN